jgi:hypothetical protein
MKTYPTLLIELAKKLTPSLAFAALIVVLTATLGKGIPPAYQALIDIVVIGGLLIYAFQVVSAALAARRASAPPPRPAAHTTAVDSAQAQQGGVVTQGQSNTTLGPGAAQAGDVGRDVVVVNVGDGGQVNFGAPASPAASSAPPHPQPPPPSTPADPQAALEAYLRAVIADCRPLRLAGLDEHAGDPSAVRLSLEDVYITLNTTATVEEEAEAQPKKGRRKQDDAVGIIARGNKKTRPLPVLAALTQQGCSVLTASCIL